MNHKLNGWNNNLTPFDGVGGKPGYHEKIPTMTPEQKAKEIVEKHYCIIEDATAGLFEEDVDYVKARQTAAKACAIEEVKAIEIALTDFGRDTDYLQSMDRTFAYYERLINEIEKL